MSPQYRYRARNWQGETVKSELNAADRPEALALLHSKKLIPLELIERNKYGSDLKSLFKTLFYRLGYRPYSNRTLMIFCRQFATMLSAGIPILQCLQLLAAQSELGSLKREISAVAGEVEEGSSLTTALLSRRESFPPLMISMVEVGETGGTLDGIMEKLADHFEKQHDLGEKIRSATLYPTFIIGVAIIVMAVMIVFVLPQFAQIFNAMGMEMPLYTRLLMGLGNLVHRQWLILSILLFSLTAFLCLAAQTKKGRRLYDQARLQVPVFGKIYRQTLAARFARILSTLLGSGVTLNQALELVDRVINNRLLSESISALGIAISEGETIAAPLAKAKYFPPLLSAMVRIGEESGALEKTLESTALFYEREVSYHVERLGTILEPALLLIVGLFIGLLVFSILSPMYQVFQMI